MGVRRKTPHYIGQGFGDGKAKDPGDSSNNVNNNNLPGGSAGGDRNHNFQHLRANTNFIRQQRAAAEAEKRLAAQEHAAAGGGGGAGGGWGLYFEDSPLELNKNQNNNQRVITRAAASFRDDLDFVPTSTANIPEDQWQYSALTLLLSVVLLSAVFLHVISDAQKSTYRGKSRSNSSSTTSTSTSKAYFDHRNYTFGVPKQHQQQQEQQRKQKTGKKKTDEWNNDDEEDEGEQPITAAAATTATTTANASSAARLMMHHPLQPAAGLQQHRHRKLSMTKEPSPFQPKNYYLNSAGGAMIANQSPAAAAAAQRPLNNNTDDYSNINIAHSMHHTQRHSEDLSAQNQQHPHPNFHPLPPPPPAAVFTPPAPHHRTTTLNPQILSPASSFESNMTTTTAEQLMQLEQQQLQDFTSGNYDSNISSKRPSLKLDVCQSPHHQSPVYVKELTPTSISQLLLSPGTDDITPPTHRKTPIRVSGLQQRGPYPDISMMEGTPRAANLRPIYNTSRLLKTPNIMDDALKPPSFPSASSPRHLSDVNNSILKFQHQPQPISTPPQPQLLQTPLPQLPFLQPPQLEPQPRTPQSQPPQRQQPQLRPYETISGSDAMAFKFASPPSASPTRHSNRPDHPPNRPEHQSNVVSVPLVPCLEVHVAQQPQPRSMNLDDLHLYQMMESGNVSHWEARVAEESQRLQHEVFSAAAAADNDNTTSQNNSKSNSSPHPQLQHANILSSFDSSDADGGGREGSSVASSDYEVNNSIPSNDVRKSIQHKRLNLTISTDAASSLQGAIEFSELRLVEVIGGGGFGQVWKAIWRGTPVAVKVLTGSAQSKNVPKPVLEEFVAEINLLKGMRHPNICLYMGACLDPPNRAIITEVAANGSLWDALRLPLMPPFLPCDGASRDSWPASLYVPDSRHGAPPSMTASQSHQLGMTTLQSSSSGPSHSFLQQRMSSHPIPPRGSWPWNLVKRVACGAARGMAYLHSGKPPVLHRDLKSANILLDESYTAKVCDFGLSRLKAQGKSMTANVGTVQWMAPEVLANLGYNEKADVYSFGIICWELLTRQCPFDGMTAIQCALAVLNRNQRPEIPKWCPPSLHALIRACVKKNPDERPTFAQIIQAFDSMP